MPSLEALAAVGAVCSEYEAADERVERSCLHCQHWGGDTEMCELEIFLTQLEDLDQT